jgi:hypothetical protein
MTENEQNLLAAYRRLYDAISEAVESTKHWSVSMKRVTDIMTGPLGDAVRKYDTLVQEEDEN